MGRTETFAYDAAEHLRSAEDIAFYLEAVLEDGEPALVRHAIGVAARAHGMAQVSQEATLSRESLQEVLSDEGDPSFDTISRVLKALGLRLSVQPLAMRQDLKAPA